MSDLASLSVSPHPKRFADKASVTTSPGITDARSSRDPTGTGRLRAAFRKAAQQRLVRLRAQMRIALVDHDVLALGGLGNSNSNMSYHPEFVRIKAFHEWFGSASAHVLGGDWARPFVEAAWAFGESKAAKELKKLVGDVGWTEEAREAALAERERARNAEQYVPVMLRAPIDFLRSKGHKIEVKADYEGKLRYRVNKQWMRAQGLRELYGQELLEQQKKTDALTEDTRPQDCAHLVQLAEQEIKGIIAAIVQQVSRETTTIVVGDYTRAKAWYRLAKVYDKTANNRLKAYANALTVMAYVQGKLTAYKSFGVKHVGITPETIPTHRVHDLDPGSRAGYGEEERNIEIQTAGDDRVCDECDKYASGSPYTIEEVLDILPVHINCRCEPIALDGLFFPEELTRIREETRSIEERQEAAAFRNILIAAGLTGAAFGLFGSGRREVPEPTEPEPITPEGEEDLGDAVFDVGWTEAAREAALAARRSHAQGFVSPNIGEMTFAQAHAALASRRQRELRYVSTEIDKALHVQSQTAPVIGAWADGAENSLMVEMHGPDPDVERASLAMKGYLADQKQVLMFQHADDGAHVMAEFHVPGSLEEIHGRLLKDGIAFHTLEPDSDGATVHVFNDNAAELQRVFTTAESYGSKVTVSRGRGEFLGTQKSEGSDREQRDDARKEYERVISEVAGTRPHLAETWNYYRDSWVPRLAQIKDQAGYVEQEHPRERGRWTEKGGKETPYERWARLHPHTEVQAGMLLKNTAPSKDRVEHWQKQIEVRQAALEKEHQLGSDEDQNLQSMSLALDLYKRWKPEEIDSGTKAIRVVYNENDKLLAVVTSKYEEEKRTAEITFAGGIDPAALTDALKSTLNHHGNLGAKHVDSNMFADDKAKIDAHTAAGFRQSGEATAGVITMIAGEEGTTAEEIFEAGRYDRAHAQMVFGMANSVAKDLGFDPEKIIMAAPDEKYPFDLNGRKYTAAGLAYTQSSDPVLQGSIKLFPAQMWDEKAVQGVTAHEIEHIKYQRAINRASIERSMMMADPGPAPNPEGKYWWEKKGGTEAMMKADGTLREPYDTKYPIYNLMEQMNIPGTEVFEKGDGVSEYSVEYWKQWKSDPFNSARLRSAFHETLAEMAKARYLTGKFPDHLGATQTEKDANAKVWRDLYRAVDKIHKMK